MFNHARTLLLNIPTPASLQRGEELIPTEFRPVVLSSGLTNVRRLLFGAQPDRAMLTYRGRQLLSLIHCCELVEFVTDLDPRLTYDLLDAPFAEESLFWPQAFLQAGASTEIYLLGQADPPDRSGQMTRIWDVELLTTTTASVALRGQLPVLESYTLSGGLSTVIPLPASEIAFQVRPDSFTPGSGPRFRVESLARPQTELGSLLAALELLGPETLADLFGTGSQAGGQEPLRTFRHLFDDHFDLAHRLGGAVLALIYRTEAIRNGSL